MTQLKDTKLGDLVEVYYDKTSQRIVNHTTKNTLKLTILGIHSGFKMVGWKRKQHCSAAGFRISDETLDHPGYNYLERLKEDGFAYGCWLPNKTEIKGEVV